MKVCTDACILGAWFAPKLPDVATVLDIGTGTGLLLLMLAQKCQAEMHGVEIDAAAFDQAKENIERSKWRKRISLLKGDVRTYPFPCKYDFIVANPPFYEHDLKSPIAERNTAMHGSELTFPELLDVIDKNLFSHGGFGVLLPYARSEFFIAMAAEKNFSPVEKLLVKQSPAHTHFRTVIHFRRHQEKFAPEFELTIQRENGLYTREFTELMRDYYLYI